MLRDSQRCYNIPVFVPHIGCPNACVFCNQNRITSHAEDITIENVEKTIADSIKTIDRSKNPYVEIAFFGGSFTGIDINLQKSLLTLANKYIKSGDVQGIRLSTRPDYINPEILDMLLSYNVTTIELGIQSMDDKVLCMSERGHTSKQSREAVELIKKYPFKLGLQMMVGLYGDAPDKSLNTAKELVSLKPDCVRVYPTLVIKDTSLEQLYLNGEYTSLSLDDAVDICKKILYIFNDAEIPVIRMGLMGSDEISVGNSVVAGPFHDNFGELVQSAVFLDKIKNLLSETKNSVIYVNPSDLSKAIGHKKQNIKKIKEMTGINIVIKSNPEILPGNVCN